MADKEAVRWDIRGEKIYFGLKEDTINDIIIGTKSGNVIDVYMKLTNLGNVTSKTLGTTKYKPANTYAVIPAYSTNPPYLQVATVWIASNGTVTLYKQSTTTEVFVTGSYIVKRES